MKILGITDVHNRSERLQHILQDAETADLVLLGGDLTSFGSPEDAERIVRIAQSRRVPVLAVAGNCDSALIDRRLVELGVSVAARGLVFNDLGIHGLSAAPPWRSDMYEFPENELALLLQAGFEQIGNARQHLVLTHVPPRDGKIDRTHFLHHVGSSALREFIDQHQPTLVVCGHVHEARGVEVIGTTSVVNCGPAASGYYAMIDLDDKVNVELRRC
ncbi:MAG: metallophosphoesterase family protein [Thermoguttaceae bacterium]